MTGIRPGITASTLLVALVLAACGGGQAVRPVATVTGPTLPLPQRHLRRAVEFERVGDPVAALREYRIAGLIDPGNRRAAARVTQLEAEIGRRARASAEAAESYRKRGDGRRERQAWLLLLSYRPGDAMALGRLRALERTREQRSLERKVRLAQRHADSRAPRNVIGYEQEAFEYSRRSLLEMRDRSGDGDLFLEEMRKHLQKYPRDDGIRSLFITTCLGRAEQAFLARDHEAGLRCLAQARQLAAGRDDLLAPVQAAARRYAAELYARGLEAYRLDTAQAARFWRLALRYDPQMGQARLRLRRLQEPGR